MLGSGRAIRAEGFGCRDLTVEEIILLIGSVDEVDLIGWSSRRLTAMESVVGVAGRISKGTVKVGATVGLATGLINVDMATILQQPKGDQSPPHLSS